MADSVDRVFVKAITTIRALSTRSNYGSLPRPPAENRIRLYGLYKQATEGDVNGIMPRPIGFTVEDEGAKKKWDAWKREEGLSKTEAKRRYISYLIETMKVYASGTHEARELLSDLEYLWDQIKDLPPQDDEDNDHDRISLPLPSYSPSLSQAGQSDRFSTVTPQQQQYRSNLQKIYSHSRRNTSLSINEYIQQQRLHQSQPQSQLLGESSLIEHHGGQGGHTTNSVYSLPPNIRSSNNQQAGPLVNGVSIEDFKNWQHEVNSVINTLTRQVVRDRHHSQDRSNGQINNINNNNIYDGLDDIQILKQKLLKTAKFLGKHFLTFLKNFSVSLLAILFIVWCFKKNVIVKKTLVSQPIGTKGKQKKELIINMILNTDENKWFIRMLSFINSFVGFV
ncbi:acyl CoA binding protein-domain-containing protein [Scheffersomyces amazonensis]|uniref:acyl CoA binding protein-domain-containing protein n=1 Tax=Scheffersomyces amazonensis TaxID=1078765 RepID=UPI00315C4ED3